MRCPQGEDLSKAVSLGPSAELAQHLQSCVSCQTEFTSLKDLRQVLQQIRTPEPSTAQVEAVRTALLSQPLPVAQHHRFLGGVALSAVGLLAAAGVLVYLQGPRGPERDPLATVVPMGRAHYEYQKKETEDVVHLHDGEVQVEVTSLKKKARFRVLVGKDEVESRGASFGVRAEQERLAMVHVRRGMAQVRAASHGEVSLQEGGTWTMSAEARLTKLKAAEPETTPVRAVTALPTDPKDLAKDPAKDLAKEPAHHRPQRHQPTKEPVEQGPEPLPKPPEPLPKPPESEPKGPEPLPKPTVEQPQIPKVPQSPADQAFATGWQALLRKEYGPASDWFRRSLELSENQAIAEDARYWLTVALARHGKTEKAITALREFLAKHPRSPRVLEASSILGWQLLNSGGNTEATLAEAERLFVAAKDAPLREIRTSAQEGLAEIATRRGR